MSELVDEENVKNIKIQDINYVKEQLKIARTELNNLRQKIQNISRGHQKDIQKIKNDLVNWRCSNCNNVKQADEVDGSSVSPIDSSNLIMKSIGVIRSHFPTKKGTPRQPSIVNDTKGQIVLYPEVFTNADHALEGLDGFSHMWIIFHFHKNPSSTRSKVAPPRLNGIRVGVFSSRSPHRPNPIGMSLVRIDKISDSTIDFFGVDMIDGTPVLDIKPYIPCYDSPDILGLPVGDLPSRDSSMSRYLSGSLEADWCSPTNERKTPTSPMMTKLTREAPDGEENTNEAAGYSPSLNVNETDDAELITRPDYSAVRVPDWINRKPSLSVTFTEKAINQLEELGCDKKSIADVLQADPRSVYIRKRYGGQCFTFLMLNCHVTCRFRDDIRNCHVIAVRKAEIVSEGNVITDLNNLSVTDDAES